MTLLVWTLLAPLLTAALGAIRASRKVEEIVIVSGLSLTFVLCLATAQQFLAGGVPSAFNDALRVDGLSALVLVLCGFVGLLSASYGVGNIRRNDARGLVTPGLRQEFSVLTRGQRPCCSETLLSRAVEQRSELIFTPSSSRPSSTTSWARTRISRRW